MQIRPTRRALIPIRQPCKTLGCSPTAIRADRVAELVLARAKSGGRPCRREIVSMIVKAHADMTERCERLEQQRPFHKSRVTETADYFQAEGLLPLTDPNVAQQRQVYRF